MSTSPLVYTVYAPQAPARLPILLRTWLPALAFSMIFALESTTYFGYDRTSAPLQRLAEMIFGYDIGVYWETIHLVIRKTGHFMAYGVFSLVCLRGFWISQGNAATAMRRKVRAHGLAILVTFLVASADEIHQNFLPNRDGSFRDVLLDTAGAVVLGAIFFGAVLLIERHRNNRAQRQITAGYAGQPVFGD